MRDDRLRTAVHDLDRQTDLYDAYQRFRQLELAYAERTASPDGIAGLSAAAAAVETHARGEAAARDGDEDTARAHLDRAHRLGLPGTDAPQCTRPRTGTDLDAVADAAEAGDRDATADLVTRLLPLVDRYCQARLQRTPVGGRATDDVVLEVVLEVIRRLPERAGRPVLGFALAVARRPVRAAPLPPDLGAGIHDLPVDLRNVLVARMFLGRSADEAAELLNMTPGAIRVAQHRASTRLRSRPEDQGAGGPGIWRRRLATTPPPTPPGTPPPAWPGPATR